MIKMKYIIKKNNKLIYSKDKIIDTQNIKFINKKLKNL